MLFFFVFLHRYRVLAIGDEKDQIRKEDELNRQGLASQVPFPQLLDWVACSLAQGSSRAGSSLPPAFVNKVLVECSHTHSQLIRVEWL